MVVYWVQVNGQQFDIALMMLKGKLATGHCVITLRTVEEKIRLIRESAMQSSIKSHSRRRSRATIHSGGSSGGNVPRNSVVGMMSRNNSERDGAAVTTPGERNSREREGSITLPNNINTSSSGVRGDGGTESIMLRVELRQIESSVAIIVNEHSIESNTDYKIENKSVCHLLHYKQKGVVGNSWRTLNPGQSCVYVWEDPFKPHKLLVLAGDNILCPSDHCNAAATALSNEFGDGGE